MKTKNLQDGFNRSILETPRSLVQYAESALKSTSLEAYIATITPELAQKLLSFNFHDNRKVSQNAVKKYAKKMQQGQWKISSPITFTGESRLIDGQHRLQAVLKAQIPVQFMVVLGVPEEVAENIDRGRRRTVTDVAKVAGLDWVTDKHAATARWMSAVIVSTIDNKNRFQARDLQTEELIPLLSKYRDGIEFAVNGISSNKKMSLSTVLSVIAKAYYVYPQKRERLQEFAYCLSKRETLKGTHDNIALKLVNRILDFKKVRGKSGGSNWSPELHSDCIHLTQSALLHFLNGNNPIILLPHEKDLFPLPEVLTK